MIREVLIMSRLSDVQLEQALDHLAHGAWQEAHVIVQQDEHGPLSCWAHGIVHLLEGDLENARYWYRRAQRPFEDPIHVKTEIAALRAALRPKAAR